MRFKSLLLCSLIASSTSALASSDREMSVVWNIQPSPASSGERRISGEGWILKQRLVPTGLAELRGSIPVSAFGVELPTGTQFIEVSTKGATVFCEPRIRPQKLIGHAQICLTDYDQDGAFEGFFKTSSETKGLLSLQGNRPKTPMAMTPIAYERLDPAKMSDEFFVAIERNNGVNLYGNETFAIAFGIEGQVERLTARITIKEAEMPREVRVLGAMFTAISKASGNLQVKVVQTMPLQPFSVIKTKQYHFY
jgi:hypothetical protein